MIKIGDIYTFQVKDYNEKLGFIITDLYKSKEGEFVGISLLDYDKDEYPNLRDFENGLIFGIKLDTFESKRSHPWVVETIMTLEENLISDSIKKVGNIELNKDEIEVGSYEYSDEYLDEYLENKFFNEIEKRRIKTEEFSKYTEIGYGVGHLFELKKIIKNKG